jgi:hypothetical protein
LQYTTFECSGLFGGESRGISGGCAKGECTASRAAHQAPLRVTSLSHPESTLHVPVQVTAIMMLQRAKRNGTSPLQHGRPARTGTDNGALDGPDLTRNSTFTRPGGLGSCLCRQSLTAPSECASRGTWPRTCLYWHHQKVPARNQPRIAGPAQNFGEGAEPGVSLKSGWLAMHGGAIIMLQN